MNTFPQILRTLLRGNTGRPLITFYDLDTGDRVEQSLATWANWVAKASSLLSEYDAERGTLVQVALPTHWLSPVFVSAVANLGAELVPTGGDIAIVGPAGLSNPAGTVLAASLLPLGRPFSEPVPAGVVDIGKEVWSQPDSFVPWEAAEPGDLLIGGRSHEEIWRAAAADPVVSPGGRLLTHANPAGDGFAAFAAVLARNASIVLVTGSGDEDAVAEQERVTERS